MEILDCQYIESQRQVIFRNSYEKRRALERKGFKVGHENYGDNTVIMVKPAQVLAEVADYTGNVCGVLYASTTIIRDWQKNAIQILSMITKII